MSEVGLHLDGDNSFKISYRNESDVRTGIADLARAYGWRVQEEVVVPGWGRIDIVLRESPVAAPLLIEIKVELTKPARIRRAFQQADGYGRWWTKDKGEPTTPLLVVCKFDLRLVEPVADAYPTVSFKSVGQVMDGLCSWGDDHALRRLHVGAALLRLQALEAIHARARDDLNRHMDFLDAVRGAKPA